MNTNFYEENKCDWVNVAFQAIWYVFLACLIMVGMRTSVAMLLCAVCVAIYLFVVPTEKALETLFFLISFENVFKISYETSSLFTYLQIIPLLKMFAVNRHTRFSRKTLLAVLLMVTYAAIFSMGSIKPIFRLCVGVALILFLFQNEIAPKLNCKRIVYAYTFGIIVSAACAYLNPELTRMFVSSLVVRLSDGSVLNRFSGLYENANYFSMEVTFALAAHLVLYVNNEENNKELSIVVAILIALGIMSQSKTFVITGVIMLLIFCILIWNKKPYLLFGIVVVVGVLFVFRNHFSGLTETYFSRLVELTNTSSSMTEVTTGRSDIWIMYIKEIFGSVRGMLFGKGIETQIPGLACHNMFIELVYCLGFLGTLLYSFMIWFLMPRTNYKRKGLIIVLIAMFLRAFAANIAFYNNVYYYYILLFLLIDANTCDERRSVSVVDAGCY